MNTETSGSTPIALHGVSKSFGKAVVLDGIDLEIRPGELFTLLGPSGCGKTTLLRCIAGFETLTRGDVRFGSEDIARLPPWERNVGFVFQNYALWPHLTVFRNVAYGLAMRRVDKTHTAERVRSMLALVGLPEMEARYPGQLSGGQQQRIAIARALVINPRVLLLDEPLSNLDAKMRVRMRQDIQALQRRIGITTIYVTHDQEEALEISDRIAIMAEGTVRQVGSAEELYNHPRDAYTADFIGRSNLLRGTLRGGVFYTPAGVPVPVNAGGRPDGPAVLCFRPERVLLGQGPRSFAAEVMETRYRGATFQHLLKLPDGTRFHADFRDRLGPGASASMLVEDCVFFEPGATPRGLTSSEPASSEPTS